MNTHPGLPTVPKDSTLDQPAIITVTINAISLKPNPSVSLTQLNSFLTTHLSWQHHQRKKSRWFFRISSTYSDTQVCLPCFQTMVLTCINVSDVSTTTAPCVQHTQTRHQQDVTVTTPNSACLTFHLPATTKGVPSHCSKGGHPTSTPNPTHHRYNTTLSCVSYWYDHPKTFCQRTIP